jgi:hypothetical protein
MIGLIVLCTGLMLLGPLRTRGAEALALNPCPRPTDQYGPRYQVMAGTYQSRGVSPGGGKFVTIRPREWTAPVSVNVTGGVFDIAGALTIGTSVILVGYVSNSASGASRPIAVLSWHTRPGAQ